MSSGEYLLLGLAALAVLAIIYDLVRSRSQGHGYRLDAAALVLVKAAEQMLPGQTGGAKLEWVMGQLDDLGFNYVEEDFMRAVIEAAVYSVKKAGT